MIKSDPKKYIYLLFLLPFFTIGQTNTFPTTGNVGVGTTNPSAKLELFGDTPIFRVTQNPGIAGAGGIILSGAGTGPKSFIQFHGGGSIWSQSGGTGTNRLEFGSSDKLSTYMTLLSGDLGVGIATPEYRLDVSGDIQFANSKYLRTKNSSGQKTRVHGINSSNIEYIGAVDQNVSGTIFGTTTDYLNLRTNSNSALYIDDNQKTGIGTTSPIAKLDVENGDIYVGEESSTNGTRRQIRVYGFDSNKKFYGSIHSNYDDTKRTFDISTNDQVYQIKIDASANASANIVLQPGSIGNVGVGTTTPLSRLHVEDVNATGEVGITIKNRNASLGTRSVIDFITTTTSTLYGSLGVENTSLGAGAMTFSTRGGTFEKMRITSNGNIGIGTTTPDSKLTVKGKVHAEEVRVDLSVPGPDYVFNSGYNLTSLEALRNYITVNKHLPNIPSAKEMEDNGIELGVMNMKLLEKIEELTLYILNQQQLINSQETRLKKIEKFMKN